MSCTFIPPYLLRHAASRAPERHARATLASDRSFRAKRQQAPLQRPTEGLVESTRRVFDAANAETLPGRLVRTEVDTASGDVAVDEAFDYFGVTLELFHTEFGRQSIDANGTLTDITVHYGVDYDNAFWDGQQLVFGDGDGQIFGRFTESLDIMAHEFTHGVTQFSVGLAYSGQSGALNESVSDVFAAMTKQRFLGQDAGDADWLIGEGLFLPPINAIALRSMLQPGTAYDDPAIGRDPQVGSMADYVTTTDDNGGVHINSGIPNRAFALLAVALGGRSWLVAGPIWYATLASTDLVPQADFAAFAAATVATAERLYPEDQRIREAVQNAWRSVGVMTDGVSSGPPATDSEIPSDVAPRTFAVRRTGGFAGLVRDTEVDLDADPIGPPMRSLLAGVDWPTVTAEQSASQPSVSSGPADRFSYAVRYGHRRVTLADDQLSPELHEVIQLALGSDADRR